MCYLFLETTLYNLTISYYRGFLAYLLSYLRLSTNISLINFFCSQKFAWLCHNIALWTIWCCYCYCAKAIIDYPMEKVQESSRIWNNFLKNREKVLVLMKEMSWKIKKIVLESPGFSKFSVATLAKYLKINFKLLLYYFFYMTGLIMTYKMNTNNL